MFSNLAMCEKFHPQSIIDSEIWGKMTKNLVIIIVSSSCSSGGGILNRSFLIPVGVCTNC